MDVKTALTDVLLSRGVEHIFGNPGSTELPFLAGLPSSLDYVMGLQEVSVVSMASGYHLRTGRIPVVNVHTGPGLGNAVGAINNMMVSHIPAVVVVGQQDSRHLHGAPILAANLVRMAAPVVKWAEQPIRAADVPRTVERAFRTAEMGTPGPVMVALPMDFLEGEAASPPIARIRTAGGAGTAVEDLASWLVNGERIALVTGERTGSAEAWAAAVTLAERLDADVFSAAFGPLAGFPTDHRLFRQHLPLTEHGVAKVLANYDRVLVVGTQTFAYYPYSQETELRESKSIALVSDIESHVATMQPSSAHALLGPVADVLRSLVRFVPQRGSRVMAEARVVAEAAAAPPDGGASGPDAGRRLAVKPALAAITRLRGRKTVLVDEALSSTPVLLRQWKQSRPRDYMRCGDGGIGFGVPASVGAALAPDTDTVCVVGDGSFYYSPQALWTAARRKLDVTYVVLNNGGYKILSDYHRSISAHLGESPSLKIPDASPAVIAQGFGVPSRVVTSAAELDEAIDWAKATGGPTLLDVAIEWSDRSMFR